MFPFSLFRRRRLDPDDDPLFARRPAREFRAVTVKLALADHDALLRAVGSTGRNQSDILRASFKLALPALEEHPTLIDSFNRT